MIDLKKYIETHPDFPKPGILFYDISSLMADAKIWQETINQFSALVKKYNPEEYRPGININDDEELVKAASDHAQTIFHPVGTCKMGNDDSAVVSDKLKVHGLNKLRVIDASIMPNITSGNTNAPTIMIAEKGADMILNG